MLDLLHFNKLDELVAILGQILVVKQSRLLYRNNLICHRVHQQNTPRN